MRNWLGSGAVALILLVVTGCVQFPDASLTSKLWDGEYDNDVRHWPSTNSLPSMYQSADGKDVLIAYEECSDSDWGTKARAYLLYKNRRVAVDGERPVFTRISKTNNLRPIPVTKGSVNQADAVDKTLRAYMDSDGRHFTLVSGGRKIGTFSLPVYSADDKVLKRITLTPVVMLADGFVYPAVATIMVGEFALLVFSHPGPDFNNR